MSAIPEYLQEAKKRKGTWHKLIISNLRQYMANEKEENIISAINQITDAQLLPILFEVGLTQTLQDVVSRRTVKLAEEAGLGGE